MALVSQETMEASFVRAVQETADVIREQAIKDAVADFETKLRESVLRHAVNLTKFYDLRKSEGNLVLTVRTGNQP